MVAQPLPDVRQFMNGLHLDLIQILLITDARVQEKGRGTEGTSAEDDFVLGSYGDCVACNRLSFNGYPT